MDPLIRGVLEKDRRAAARLMTLVENGSPRTKDLLAKLYPRTGNAHVVGITGPPGSGKSTIVDKLTREYCAEDRSVGIIAVDPTSPFTGGALLGDRVRMGEAARDERVFVRSMGTRGKLGGLAKATNDLVKILDAFGKDIILVETIGAGQSEVDIIKTAHTSVVVEVPGLGDDIQAIKAGILEIGDVLVVNKADKEGAERTARELRTMLGLNPPYRKEEGWIPPVLKAVARTGDGIPRLLEEIDRHMAYLKEGGDWSEVIYNLTKHEFTEIVKEDIGRFIMERTLDADALDDIVRRIIARELDPYSASEKLMERFRD